MTAREQFEAGESEVRLLLSLCSFGDDPSQANTARDNAVRRSAVVLLVSHFESFLRLLAEDFIEVLSTGELESRFIPRGVREIHTLPRISAISTTADPVQRQSLLKKLSDVATLWNDDAKPPRGTLKGTSLSREVTSARPEKIDRLFQLMGSQVDVCDGDIDIAAEGDDATSPNIRLSLEDVVQCRNDIAHGDSSRIPTAEDVDRYLEFLAAFADRLARKAGGLSAAYLP